MGFNVDWTRGPSTAIAAGWKVSWDYWWDTMRPDTWHQISACPNGFNPPVSSLKINEQWHEYHDSDHRVHIEVHYENNGSTTAEFVPTILAVPSAS
jgi:hypothetical protein